ncbi:MAG: response regulator [Geothrix sp.]|uniref:response regulator n=1 Tax=Geothrix sp. TaxID=1962974 RepID=UPI003BB106A4
MEPRNPTILVADDTPTNLELVDSVLGEDFELLIATNGQEALDLALAEGPLLILMDVMMPVMDGIEACRRIKADSRTQDIPILFLTALADTEALLRGFSAGGADYVSKPFHPEELRARVATHVALKQARDQERVLREQLEEALASIKQLSGLLPICATCKKIRDEQGAWNPLEVFISEHSEADFTHGICPDCAQAFRASNKRG